MGTAGVVVLAAGVAYAGWSAAAEDPSSDRAAPGRLRSGAATVSGQLLPGVAVTGTLVVHSTAAADVAVFSGGFGPTATDAAGCPVDSVAFALTVEPAAGTPLLVPAAAGAPDAATAIGWTAYLTPDAAAGCQGATFSSTLTLDRDEVGTVTAVAGRVAAPGRPVGGSTTSTSAGVQWAPAPGVPAYLVERAPAGTTAWAPACGGAPVAGRSCTDTGLTPRTTYRYRVTSVLGAWRASSLASADVRTRCRPSAG